MCAHICICIQLHTYTNICTKKWWQAIALYILIRINRPKTMTWNLRPLLPWRPALAVPRSAPNGRGRAATWAEMGIEELTHPNWLYHSKCFKILPNHTHTNDMGKNHIHIYTVHIATYQKLGDFRIQPAPGGWGQFPLQPWDTNPEIGRRQCQRNALNFTSKNM